MAMSIVHGGQSPCFLSPILFESLLRGPDNVTVSISDVADPETHLQLQAVCCMSVSEQSQYVLCKLNLLIFLL